MSSEIITSKQIVAPNIIELSKEQCEERVEDDSPLMIQIEQFIVWGKLPSPQEHSFVDVLTSKLSDLKRKITEDPLVIE